eukprot:s2683_g12.t1
MMVCRKCSCQDVAGAGCGDSGGPLFVMDTQVGVVSYTAAGRDVFTRVHTFLDWINGDCDETQLPYSERADLLDKCKASCMRCPICEATNSSCCDTVGFTSGRGHACTQWAGVDCTTAMADYGYSSEQMAELIESCPFSCGACRGGASADPEAGYEQVVEDMVLKHCPLSCGTCTPPSTSTTTTSTTSGTTGDVSSSTPATTSTAEEGLSGSISSSGAASLTMALVAWARFV